MPNSLVRTLFSGAALCLALAAGCATVPRDGQPVSFSTGAGLARLQREAETLKPLVKSRWAGQFLEASKLIPGLAPRRIYVAPDGTRAYTAKEAESLPPSTRANFNHETVDEIGYYYGPGTPLLFARLIDLIGETERASIVGRRFLELDYSAVGALRMLAAFGVDAVGVSSSARLRALYSLPGDQGTVAVPGRDTSGHLQLSFGRFPQEPTTRTEVGTGFDGIFVLNQLKRGTVHPTVVSPEGSRFELGMSDEDYLRALHDSLRPGGRLIIYNICPPPPPPDQPYSPHSDCRAPFAREAFLAAGLRVRDYDRSDTETARAFHSALGLTSEVFALFTLVERQ